MHLGIIGLLSLAAPLLAQRTWTVDRSNGPGTDFTDLPPAVAAAAPGDTILVRAGAYASTTIRKGVRLLGQGQVQVANLTLDALPSQQEFVAKGLGVTQLTTQNCVGRLHIESVQVGPLIAFARIRNCRAVTIANCTLRATSIDNSLVALSNTTLLPDPGTFAAANITSSDVYLSHCTAIGSAADCRFAASPPA